MAKSKKIAIVGLGLMGARHLTAAYATQNIEVSAIVDISEESKAVANEHGIQHFVKIEDMLKVMRPDGAVIATPNALHIEAATPCVAESIPVLIEKPLGVDIKSVETFLNIAEQKNVPVLTGYFRRFNPVVSVTKNEITQGNIGDLVSVHCTFWLYKHKEYYRTNWRIQKGGGPIHINLAHEIDLLRYFMGEITEVTAFTSNATRKLQVEDTAVIMCRFKNGALGTINVSDTIPSPWSWELTAGDNPAYPKTDQVYCLIGGTHGSIQVPNNKLWYYENERHWYTPINTRTFKKSVQDPLVVQLEHFGRVIAGEEQPMVSGRDSLIVMQVIDAVNLSAVDQRTVRL